MMTCCPDSPTLPPTQPASEPAASLWMPPQRLRRYQAAKLVGALLFILIFAGWLALQWSNPAMRWLTVALIGITAWVTVASVVSDLRRSAGRQVAMLGAGGSGEFGWMLRVTSPAGEVQLKMADVVIARWREDEEASLGLWFFDDRGSVMAHLDGHFLADQDEARALIAWLRRQIPSGSLPFPVQWPPVAGG
jgi:hypothetical protein